MASKLRLLRSMVNPYLAKSWNTFRRGVLTKRVFQIKRKRPVFDRGNFNRSCKLPKRGKRNGLFNKGQAYPSLLRIVQPNLNDLVVSHVGRRLQEFLHEWQSICSNKFIPNIIEQWINVELSHTRCLISSWLRDFPQIWFRQMLSVSQYRNYWFNGP